MQEPRSIYSLAGRIGGYTRWSRVSDRTEATAAPRAAFLARFDREVDPEGKLDPITRAERAEAARRAHFARMALARRRTSIRQRRGA